MNESIRQTLVRRKVEHDLVQSIRGLVSYRRWESKSRFARYQKGRKQVRSDPNIGHESTGGAQDLELMCKEQGAFETDTQAVWEPENKWGTKKS